MNCPTCGRETPRFNEHEDDEQNTALVSIALLLLGAVVGALVTFAVQMATLTLHLH